MEKKGALGLPVNLLVVIILSLVILTGGIAFLYQLMEEAWKFKEGLDAQTKAKLRSLLEGGQKIALAEHAAYLSPGEEHLLGLGVLNINEDKFGSQFKVKVALSKAYNEEKPETIFPDPAEIEKNWLFYTPELPLIKENQYQTKAILVMVPKEAQKGTYIFDIEVSCGGQECFENSKEKPYGFKKFSVVVE